MKKLIIWIMVAAAVCACSRDLGNYEYSDLTEPGISGVGDCSVLTFSELRISPSFTEGFDEGLYTFEWKAIDRNGTPWSLSCSSNQKNLTIFQKKNYPPETGG